MHRFFFFLLQTGRRRDGRLLFLGRGREGVGLRRLVHGRLQRHGREPVPVPGHSLDGPGERLHALGTAGVLGVLRVLSTVVVVVVVVELAVVPLFVLF